MLFRLCLLFLSETVDTAIYDTLVKKEGVKRVHFGNIPIVTLSARWLPIGGAGRMVEILCAE